VLTNLEEGETVTTRKDAKIKPKKKSGRMPPSAVTHGLYEASLRIDERELWSSMGLDTLDDEVRMTRVRLRRAYKLEELQQTQLSKKETEEQGLHLYRITRGISPEGAFSSRERQTKDWGEEIKKIVEQLNRLITLRNQVLKGTAEELDGEARAKAMEEASKSLDRMFKVVKE